MVELRHRRELECDLGFAGDTYNTAVYLHRVADRLGISAEVGYLTGLGDDPYSELIRAAWSREGIKDRSITVPGRQPGLYAVNTDARGERSFTYWRSTSAAAALFAGTGWIDHLDGDLIHFSGITLQLMSRPARRDFFARLAVLRQRGSTVSFDTNFRPAGWSDPAAAREVFARAAANADIILATNDDEHALWGDRQPQDALERYRAWGAREVVLKMGADGALVADGPQVHHIEATPVPLVVDTTAAGDSFAGGYLAGRLARMPPAVAAGLGAELAAVVIQSPGAIIARV
jgi:2-dehydro-3-deoxygluconokinase